MKNKVLKNVALVALAAATVLSTSLVQARPGPGPIGMGRHGPIHRGIPAPMHHHHSSRGWAIGAGILGAGIIAGSIVDAMYPRSTVVYPTTTYVAPTTTYVAPATTVVQPVTTTVVQPAGQYVTQQQQVWVEGCWVNQVQANGAVVRVWQPGHYETRSTQVWVSQ